jgi:hypothetical protein
LHLLQLMRYTQQLSCYPQTSSQIPVVEDKEKKTAVITGRGGAINVDSEELSLGEA